MSSRQNLPPEHYQVWQKNKRTEPKAKSKTNTVAILKKTTCPASPSPKLIQIVYIRRQQDSVSEIQIKAFDIYLCILLDNVIQQRCFQSLISSSTVIDVGFIILKQNRQPPPTWHLVYVGEYVQTVPWWSQMGEASLLAGQDCEQHNSIWPCFLQPNQPGTQELRCLSVYPTLIDFISYWGRGGGKQSF